MKFAEESHREGNTPWGLLAQGCSGMGLEPRGKGGGETQLGLDVAHMRHIGRASAFKSLQSSGSHQGCPSTQAALSFIQGCNTRAALLRAQQ